jgi:type VI secretion system secreted protein VgrG
MPARRLASVSVAALATLALVACGGDDEPVDVSTATAPTVPTATQPSTTATRPRPATTTMPSRPPGQGAAGDADSGGTPAPGGDESGGTPGAPGSGGGSSPDEANERFQAACKRDPSLCGP